MRRSFLLAVCLLLVAAPAAQALVRWRPPPAERCAGQDGKARIIAEAKWTGSGWKDYKFIHTRTKGTDSRTRSDLSTATTSWSDEGWTWQTGTIVTKIKRNGEVIRRWETRLKPC